jgi:uncharacterized protein with GYD domain
MTVRTAQPSPERIRERNQLMPKFLVEASYTAEGHKGLAKEKASGRKAVVAQAIKKLGGKLEAMYFCLGEHDVILIADLPDHLSAAALGSAACATGMVHTKTTVLLTVAETDEALSKSTSYRGPGA